LDTLTETQKTAIQEAHNLPVGDIAGKVRVLTVDDTIFTQSQAAALIEAGVCWKRGILP